MLEFFKRRKKDINTDDINNFNKALKVVDSFVSMEDFEKAYLAINEIKTKEVESFNEYIENVKENERKQKNEKFKEKLKKIQKIKNKIDKKKIVYDIRFKKKQREIEKKQLENLIKELITSKNFLKA
jgi:ribosomal protein L22